MIPLSEITKEDAYKILAEEYSMLLQLDNKIWKLKDETETQKESCKSLISRYSEYRFWFYDDGITIEHDDLPIGLTVDVHFKCYIKAHNLGYNVPVLSELLNINNK